MIKIHVFFLPAGILDRLSKAFLGIAEKLLPIFTSLEQNLIQAELDISDNDYLAKSLTSSFFYFLVVLVLGIIFFLKFGNVWFAPVLALTFSLFLFMQQMWYPRAIALKRIRNIERNLISALRTVLIQVNSGVPLFNVMVSLSNNNYGEISTEFKKVVREISAGSPEVDALENVSTKNPSIFFRRSIWQIVNGIKAGSSIESVLKDVVDALSQEQIIQIENYGQSLNPLAMFYMLTAIILPALSMMLMVVVSSFIHVSQYGVYTMFFSLFFFVLLLQFIFFGMINSRRPNLLGD